MQRHKIVRVEKMKLVGLHLYLLILLPVLSGCTQGLLFTNQTTPLVKNFNKTPVGTRSATIGTREIREPFTAANLSAIWNSRAIGDTAKKEDLKEIGYADRTVFSILGGIWRQESVTVWGE